MKDFIGEPKEHNDTPTYLSVSEAQEFFEESSLADQSRSGEKENKRRAFAPGDFTPQWGDAQTSQNSDLGSVDIPILPKYKYRAIRSEFKHGKAQAYVVEVSQKLIVVKSKHTQKREKYILSLIPDKDYASKNKGDICKKFLNSGNKGEFSGLALYTTQDGSPVRLNKYKNGVKKAGVSVLGISDDDEKERRLKLIVKTLSQLKIQSKQAVAQTRFGEDDYGFDDYLNDMYDSYDDGTTITFDDDGNAYVDTNGDGYPEDIWGAYDGIEVDPDPNSDMDGQSDPFEDCGGCGDCWECGYDNIGGDIGVTDPEEPKLIAPNAKKIFRNSNMTEKNWKLLEKMLEKIMADCMGGKLYNKLDGLLGDGTVAIQFDPNANSASWDGNTITLTNFESNTLLHEMFHIYQGYQETPSTPGNIGSFDNALGNLEIEATIASYKYLSSLPEYSLSNKWGQKFNNNIYGRKIIVLSDNLTSNSQFNKLAESEYNSLIHDTILTLMQLKKDYTIDIYRTGAQNIKNLLALTGGCL